MVLWIRWRWWYLSPGNEGRFQCFSWLSRYMKVNSVSPLLIKGSLEHFFGHKPCATPIEYTNLRTAISPQKETLCTSFEHPPSTRISKPQKPYTALRPHSRGSFSLRPGPCASLGRPGRQLEALFGFRLYFRVYRCKTSRLKRRTVNMYTYIG